jgi:hypothetical protein
MLTRFTRFTRRLALALIAAAALLPAPGCGCRKSCCNSSSSLAPPPGPCCDKALPPNGYLPPPAP